MSRSLGWSHVNLVREIFMGPRHRCLWHWLSHSPSPQLRHPLGATPSFIIVLINLFPFVRALVAKRFSPICRDVLHRRHPAPEACRDQGRFSESRSGHLWVNPPTCALRHADAIIPNNLLIDRLASEVREP